MQHLRVDQRLLVRGGTLVRRRSTGRPISEPGVPPLCSILVNTGIFIGFGNNGGKPSLDDIRRRQSRRDGVRKDESGGGKVAVKLLSDRPSRS